MKIIWILILSFLGCKNDIQRPPIYTLFLPSADIQNEKIGVVSTDFSSGGRFYLIDSKTFLSIPSISNIHSDAVFKSYDNKIYIINRLNRDSILILDSAIGYLPTKEFSVGSGSNPQDLVIIRNKAYVSLYNKSYLAIVNLDSASIEKTIDLSQYTEKNTPSGDTNPEMNRMSLIGNIIYLQLQRLDRGRGTLYPTPNTDSYILKIDTNSDTIIGFVPTPTPNPFSKMQKLVIENIDHLVMCVPGKLGYISELDGGISALNLSTGEFRKNLLLKESTVGGDILDMSIKNENEGYAYVLDKSFNKQIIKFNPLSGEKILTLANFSSELGNISGLTLSSDGKLFLGDASLNNPGVTVYDTNSAIPQKLTVTPINVGLRPFELGVIGKQE